MIKIRKYGKLSFKENRENRIQKIRLVKLRLKQ